jgi:hypothetical protein
VILVLSHPARAVWLAQQCTSRIDPRFSAGEIPGRFVRTRFCWWLASFDGLIFCAFLITDRAVLKITEEEFSRPPMDVRTLNTGDFFIYLVSLFAIYWNLCVYRPVYL